MSMDRKEMTQQFQALANALETLPQDQLTSMALTSCVYLLEQLGGSIGALDRLSSLERSEIMGGYAQVSDCVDRFAQQARRQLGIDAALQLHEGSMRNLQAQQQRASELQQRVAALEQETRQQQAQLAQDEPKLAILEEVYANQQSRLQQCAPEILKGLTDRNVQMERQLQIAEPELTRLQREIAEKEVKVQALDTAIAQADQKDKALLDEHMAKEAYLERLQKVETECSPQKQQQMKQQIEELEPKVNKLEADTKKLQEILDKLRTGQTNYDQATQTLTTDILTLIDDAIGQLQSILPGHREALQEVKNTSETMQKSLKECKALAEGYRAWFDQDRLPLEAWKKAVQAPEYAQLQDVLDVSNCNRVKVLSAQIEQALKELDELVKACSAAIRHDQKTIERKANGK